MLHLMPPKGKAAKAKGTQTYRKICVRCASTLTTKPRIVSLRAEPRKGKLPGKRNLTRLILPLRQTPSRAMLMITSPLPVSEILLTPLPLLQVQKGRTRLSSTAELCAFLPRQIDVHYLCTNCSQSSNGCRWPD